MRPSPTRAETADPPPLDPPAGSIRVRGANEGFHIGDAAANFVCVKWWAKFAAASKVSVQTDF